MGQIRGAGSGRAQKMVGICGEQWAGRLGSGQSGYGGALDLTLVGSREPLMDSEEVRGRIRE